MTILSPWTTLSFVCVLAAALRLWGIADSSIWFDEASSYTYATEFGFFETLDRSALNVHPPLHYFALKLWIAVFGDGLLELRSFSVALGLATIVVFYLFCRDACTECNGDARTSCAVGLFASALLAVSAPHVLLSQQCRMYTLGTLLAVASSWCLIRAIRPYAPAWWWIGYTISATSFLYTHNFAIFSVLWQIIFMLCVLAATKESDARYTSTRRGGMAAAAVAALYSPWVPVLMTQSARVRTDYWSSGLGVWTLPDVMSDLFLPGVPATEAVGLVSLGVVIFATVGLAMRRGIVHWLLCGLVMFPIAGGVFMATTGTATITARFLSFSHLFVISSIAILVCGMRESAFRRWLIVVALTVVASGTVFALASPTRRNPGLAGAVRHIVAHRVEEGLVVVLHPCLLHAARFHLRGIADVKLYATSRRFSHYGAGPFLDEKDLLVPAELSECSLDRLWILETTGYPAVDGYEMPAEWHRKRGTVAEFREARDFQGTVTASLFQRMSGVPK